ncbi:hypothetical protein GCM10010307_37300 [Streptomyces vastus]|uniref:Uncharacterized protein n=1 Tax=Streptomyces vastus TaxID=285451 RepID=A0ABN3R001_9ACTN
MQGDGDGGSGGIKSEQEHANSLRRPGRRHRRPGPTGPSCYRHLNCHIDTYVVREVGTQGG